MSRGPTKRDLEQSTEWGIAGLKSIGVGIGPIGGQIAMYDLACRTTYRAHRVAVYSGTAGIGLPVSGSFTNDDYTYFRTRRPVAFPDFDRTRATVTSSSALIYSWSTLKIFDRSGDELAFIKMSGFGLSVPELASGGEARTEVYYGNGRPVEDPEWKFEFKPPAPEDVVAPDRAARADHAMVLTIKGDALFEFDKSEILPEAEAYLDRAWRLIFDSRGVYKRISIEGHTDSVGRAGYNLNLSKARAEAVKSWFHRNLVPAEVNARKWETVGHGEFKPVDSNRSPSGRARNRRVEVILWDR